MTPVIPDPDQAVLGGFDGDGAAPEFAMSVWKDEQGDQEAVSLLIHTTTDPAIERHASMGLLYGLAILILDQQGRITDTIRDMVAQGPISEAEAVARINFLLKDDANDEPV